MKRKFQIKALDWLLTGIYVILFYGIYASTLRWLVINDWEREGYSYCYLIPFVVIYLLWNRWKEFKAVESKPGWWGLLLILFGLTFFWLGELGGEFLTLYMSMWLVLIGLCWMHFGWRKLKIIGFPLFFILTMFPLPSFLLTRLTLKLRLISSWLGVSMIDFLDIPAYCEGNIIDLGFTQLQVVDACSGLHSLNSLVVLCLLLVYFFKTSFWKRAVLLISSIPIAIFANSTRIASTAILSKYFGTDVAQGFFHGFSGLLIFVFCIPILLIEMKILEKLPPIISASPSGHRKVKGSKQKTKNKKDGAYSSRLKAQFVVVVVLLTATLAFSQGIEFRENIPSSKPFSEFPLQINKWSADHLQAMEQKFIDALDLSDYVVADYENDGGKRANLYVAYYKSQKKGESIHSPATCLPGSGWIFEQSGTVTIPMLSGKGAFINVNRALMKKAGHKQLVYYWFQQRGRILTNAYQLKIYTFWDALIKQRTDGALVRLITTVCVSEKLEEAEARLQEFTRNIIPVLDEYIPGKKLE